MNYKEKRIAILGGTGQLGNSLKLALSNKLKITTFSSKSFPFPDVNIEEKLSKYDIIINCVGYPKRSSTAASQLYEDQSKKLNYEFVVFITDYCKKTKKKLIHFSSNIVYSSKDIYLHNEEEYNYDTPMPYDKHKLDSDIYIQKHLDNFLIICIYNFHGTPILNKQFFDFIFNILSHADDKIRIVDELTCQFVSGSLIAQAVEFLLSKNVNGVYNLSTEWMYRKDFIKMFLDIVGKDVKIEVVPISFFKIPSVSHRLASCDKLKSLGFIIPSTYDDMKNWWGNDLTSEHKKNIIDIIEKIEVRKSRLEHNE